MSDMIDALLQRYEMGQAYKRITAEMGPSPQLVAFVNYENIDNGNLGLESMNIMDQHELILNEIENDSSYEIACESFVGKIKSALGRIKIALTLNDHAKDLDKFLSGTLESRSSSVNAVSHADFERLVSIVTSSMTMIAKAQSLPVSVNDLEGWGKLNIEDLNKQFDIFWDKTLEVNKIKTTDFDKGGWNTENFRTSIRKYKAISDKAMPIYGKAETQAEALLKLADKYGKKEHASSVKAVIAQFDLMWQAAALLEEGEAKLWKTMNDVAQHFKVAD